jgi:hypothetical protein
LGANIHQIRWDMLDMLLFSVDLWDKYLIFVFINSGRKSIDYESIDDV